MQDAFAVVIFAVVGLGAVAALLSLPGTGRLYDRIGRGDLSIDDDGGPPPRVAGVAHAREREDEIRQMLTARNVRRAARGEAGHDVESELAELVRPRTDPALRAEVRELVVARNARRAARGREPLDVDAEIERRLRGLPG